MADSANPQSLKMIAAAYYIPKDNIDKPEGQDAHFLCLEKQTIGVADGVGGWSAKGVDAGIYARELMANCVTAMDNLPMGNVHPNKVLKEAYVNTKPRGSSTACIITLTDQRILKAAHVCDSGFWLFRNNRNVGQSQIQQKSFNHPYQLGNKSDSPKCAIKTKFLAIPGDVVVLGTDGLLDNMYPSQIEDVLREKKGEI